ncbi:YCF48-related protein [Nevskia sp.]|uniref:WD40/YVTN/BNR-like repeat-containing protein n=1 Tax=Nevskia sp. TaxID=1929292 RepID=UPI0025D838C6|nr:YCF48-related protein [Nevskia sp.]
MRHSPLKLAALIFGLSALPLSLLITTQAQQEPAAAPVEADAASAPVESATEAAPESSSEPAAAEAVAKPIAPRSSEIAGRAVNNPLLRVVNTGKHYVAVGVYGHILISADGAKWNQVASPVDVMLTSVTFADENNGWAVGHDAVILHTADGGETWKQQNFQPELNKPLFDVLFLDAQTGFAVGAYGLMLATTDGGSTWAQVAANPVTEGERHFNALAKLGDGSLMVVGEAGTIGVSADRGLTWTKLTTPYESSLFCVIAAGDKGALIGGLRGNSFYSADVRVGSWKKMQTNSDQSLFGMAALPGDKVAMVGLNATLLIFEPGKPVHSVPIIDKLGNRQTESLSWLTMAPDGGLIVVGDAGVQRLDAAKF